MSNRMEYFYFPRRGDQQQLTTSRSELETLTDLELTKQMARARQVGVVGARAQMQRMIALYQVAKKRGIDCPITIENNCAIAFRGEDKET